MNRRGFTLLEVLTGFWIMAMIGGLLLLALRSGTRLWIGVSSGNSAETQLRKALFALQDDLGRTAFSAVERTEGLHTLAAADGDALWCLSPVDPITAESLRKGDGTPFWQRNILYYLVVPLGHDQLAGHTCIGGDDGNGYDDRCPHKVLVRKVIDHGSPTDPADQSTEETLISPEDIRGYLTRPQGYELSSMSEPGLETAQIQARNLLYFRVQLAPAGEYPREIRIDLRAVELDAARRRLQIGATSLGESSFTLSRLISVFPRLP